MTMYKGLITTDDTEIICSICHRPTGMVVEGRDFIGVAICSICFGRSCISSDEVQHAMDRMFEALEMGIIKM
jgi:hypothetical protein